MSFDGGPQGGQIRSLLSVWIRGGGWGNISYKQKSESTSRKAEWWPGHTLRATRGGGYIYIYILYMCIYMHMYISVYVYAYPYPKMHGNVSVICGKDKIL